MYIKHITFYIKPANIFITKNFEVLLGDFGSARYDKGTEKTEIGTRQYFAPEKTFSDISKITRKVDSWALGCLLYELCTHQRAFFLNNENEY